jgi:hypothetical protein
MEEIKSKINILFLLVIIAFVAFNSFQIYTAYSQYQSAYEDLQKRAETTSIYKDIVSMQQQIDAITKEVSDRYYTESKLFSFWINAESLIPYETFSINKDYVSQGGIKYFTGTVSIKTDPITAIRYIKNIKPPLYIDNIAYSNGATNITFRGAILTSNSSFVLTEDLIKQSSYIVCRLVYYTSNPDLVPNDGTYFVSKQGDMYYVGIPLARNLDNLSAQQVASDYAKQGIITFIAGGK